MKKINVLKRLSWLFLAAIVSFSVASCSDDDEPTPPPLDSGKDITAFAFNGLTPSVTANISGTNITASVPYTVDPNGLVPTITVSANASVTPASGVAQDFSNPVTYTVAAEDGTEAVYTVTVTVEAPPVLAVSSVWERNLNSGGLPGWFTANNDRDITVHGEYVFVHNNNDRIRVVSSADGSDVMVRDSLSFIDGKENFASGNLFLLGTSSDNQGRIVSSNLRVGSDSEFPWNVYVWDNKDASQELLFAYPTPGGYRLGENLQVVGDVRNDAIVYVPGSGFGTESNEVLKFTITGGVANTTPQAIALQGIANMGNAPDVYPVSAASDANIIVAGTGIGGIAEFSSTGNLIGRLPEELNTGETALLFTFALDVAYFEISGRRVIATTSTDFTQNAASAGYLYLIDITDGWENITAENISRTAFTPSGNLDTNFNGTGGVEVVVDGDMATVYAIITNFGIGAYNVSFE